MSSPRKLCCRDDPALLSGRDSGALDARLACHDGAALLPSLSKLGLGVHTCYTWIRYLSESAS